MAMLANGTGTSRPVILSPLGGLANRMRAIDSTLTICRKRNRPLEIVWIRDRRQINARFCDLFESQDLSNVSLREATALDRLRFAQPVWRRNAKLPLIWQRLRFGSVRRLSISRGLAVQRQGSIPPQFDLVNRTVFLHAWWQIVPTETPYAFFRPLPSLLAEINNLASSLPGSRCIGVHVRRGDHAQATRQSPTSAFETRMDAMLSSGEADSFFLATDNDEVRHRLSRRYGERLVFRKGSSARSSLDGMRGAVVDLWTLSRCSHLLSSSGSTFAPTAAVLGGIPFETMCVPKP